MSHPKFFITVCHLLTNRIHPGILTLEDKKKKAMSGTSIFCCMAENCGPVRRSSRQKRNPPVSLRDERLRLPPLAGCNEFHFV
jgi:hypothetical protein